MTAISSIDDFDTVTRWPLERGTGEGAYPQSWGQGRATFGGAVAATGLHAARSLVDAERAPLSLDVAFLGPVTPERTARVEARVLRTGKYMTTIEANVLQGDETCARMLVTCGMPRVSRIALGPAPRVLPAMPAHVLPFVPGLTPTFLQHFELTWASGAYPFSGAKEPGFAGFCRHRTRATGLEALVGLVDAWPGPILPLMTGPAAASTVRWALHLTLPHSFDPGAQCFFDSRLETAHAGYSTTTGHLYDHAGAHIAWSEQLVAFFEPK